jgi:hypothetical protein
MVADPMGFFLGIMNQHAEDKIVITLDDGSERFFDYLIDDVVKFWNDHFVAKGHRAATTQRSPLVHAKKRILRAGYRNANQIRPRPTAMTPAPASISTVLCGPANNPVPCPNQKSPTAISSGPTTRRTIFMRASFDRAR